MAIRLTKKKLILGSTACLGGIIGGTTSGKGKTKPYEGPKLISLENKEWQELFKVGATNPLLLDTYQCHRTLFPGAPIPGKHVVVKATDEEAAAAKDKGNAALKVSPKFTDAPNTGPMVGCLYSKYQQKDKSFLLRSELSVKTEKVGMTLWLGVKSFDGTSNKYQVYSMYHVAFYEKEEDGKWNLKAGFAWKNRAEDDVKPIQNRIIKLDAPWKKVINMGTKFHSNKQDDSYFGVGEENGEGKRGGDKAVSIGTYGGNYSYPEFSPVTAMGYHTVNIFMYEPNGVPNEGNGKDFKNTEMKMTQTMEDGFIHFRIGGKPNGKHRLGTGTKREDFCKLPLDERNPRLKDICL